MSGRSITIRLSSRLRELSADFSDGAVHADAARLTREVDDNAGMQVCEQRHRMNS